MNQNELRKALRREGINDRCYSLEAKEFDPDETLCLRQENSKWVVYYSERGLKTGKQTFQSEADACSYFLDTMLHDPTTRRSWSSGFAIKSAE